MQPPVGCPIGAPPCDGCLGNALTRKQYGVQFRGNVGSHAGFRLDPRCQSCVNERLFPSTRAWQFINGNVRVESSQLESVRLGAFTLRRPEGPHSALQNTETFPRVRCKAGTAQPTFPPGLHSCFSFCCGRVAGRGEQDVHTVLEKKAEFESVRVEAPRIPNTGPLYKTRRNVFIFVCPAC